MLISLHLPRTAGTSFRKSLALHFGSRLLMDYRDFPINTPKLKRNISASLKGVSNLFRDYNEIECIYGHFLPIKYFLLGKKTDVKFITWMRDPVERLISHYFYWKRTYDPKRAQALHRRVVEEGWTLESFCLSDEMRNFYSQFLWEFSLSNFHFVGITEHYEDDFQCFSREFLGTSLPMFSENSNPDRESGKYYCDKTLRKKIEDFHAKDIQLYHRALAMRQ